MPCLLPVLTLAVVLSSGPAPIQSRVAGSASGICPALVGSAIPDVDVATPDGEPIGLREALDGRPTVLVVYRGGWCPVCTTQLAGLVKILDPLERLGVQLLAVSADSPEGVRRSLEGAGSRFRLLSDFDLNATRALGLAFRVEDAYVEKLDRVGLDYRENALSTEQVLPVPAVFVVSPEGRITFSYVNPDYTVRCEPGVILAAARAVTGRS